MYTTAEWGARLTAARAGALVVLATGCCALAGCGSGQGSSSLTKIDAPPGSAARNALGRVPPPGQYGRNVVRVTGTSPADVAGSAVLSTYPPGSSQPRGWILTRDDDWRVQALAAQFAASPVDAAVLPINRDYLPPAANDLLGRLRPPGFPKAKGLQAFVLGDAGSDVFSSIQNDGLKPSQLKAPTPADLAARVVPYRAGFAGALSSDIAIVSEQDRDFALPAAAWSAYSGDTLAFVARDAVPAATIALLVQRAKVRLERPHVYLFGPAAVISEGVAARLSAYATVTRIPGSTPAALAVNFARYHDSSTGFGWGLQRGPASLSFVNPRQWGNAVAAFTYAARGPQAPLLLTDEHGSLSSDVVAYLAELRDRQPSGAFAFGDVRSIPTRTLVQLDYALDAVS